MAFSGRGAISGGILLINTSEIWPDHRMAFSGRGAISGGIL